VDQSKFHKLVSGQKTGPIAAALRFLPAIAAVVYSLVIRFRNLLYSTGLLKTYRVDATVISIGNITTGGTGKTPLVIWLTNLLSQKGVICAILTRGYKAHNKTRTTSDERRVTNVDEPAILKQGCPAAEVIVNPNRVEGAKQAIEKHNAKVLILDDGFQHRRLARDLDIVAIDATRPFGYGKILPAGLLREPLCSLKRAEAIIITRTDQVSQTQLNDIENRLLSINPDLTIAKTLHAPVCVKTDSESQIELEQMKGKKVFAFCGIGNPDAFLATIKELQTELVGSEIYNDHYHYTENDINYIIQQSRNSKADFVLTTEKDWTKIASLKPIQKDIQMAYLKIEIRFITGKDKLRQLIETALTGKISETNN